MTVPAPALHLRGISKRFGSTLALDDVSFTVASGTLHALLGENGAGKTTLMRIAFGLARCDHGSIEVDGTEHHFHSSADAIAAGLGMVHQHFMLVPALTVTENIVLGDCGFFGGFHPSRAAERVRQLCEETGLGVDPLARVSELAVGAQQRVEILKAVSRNARLLIFDEPTAVLTPRETDELYSWLRVFVRGGGTVVLITHKLREALTLADDVTVLRRGRSVLQSTVHAVDEAQVVSALLGEGPALRTPSPVRVNRTTGDTVLSATSVTVADTQGSERLHGVNALVRAGEIVGIAGVEGAGQWELLRVLAGRVTPQSGSVRLPAHIGFVPEDRLRDAIIPEMTLAENVVLPRAGGLHGRIAWSTYAEKARALALDHGVRPPDARAVGTLSGGNQQKFVLARELEGSPEALVVENPTRGLDIRASDDVLERLRAARDTGCAVVMYSSDLEEIVSLADRMLVCFNGTVIETPVDTACVGRAMIGLS